MAHFYGMELYGSGGNPEGLSGNERFDWYGTSLPANQRLEIFRKAYNQLVADFGIWEVPWGEYNRFQRLSGDINLTMMMTNRQFLLV